MNRLFNLGGEAPPAHRVYGGIVYWTCLCATILSMIGLFLAVAWPEHAGLPPALVFARIWEGKHPSDIWAALNGTFPGLHFWVRHPMAGDGMIHLGLVMGVVSAMAGFGGTAAVYLRHRGRELFWAVLSLLCAALVLSAMLDLMPCGE